MKIVINKKLILWIVLTIPFLDSPICDQYVYLDYIFKIGKIVTALSLLGMLFSLKHKLSDAFYLILSMNLLLVFATIYNHAAIGRCLNTVLSLVFTCLLYDLGLRRENVKDFISAQYVCFSIAIYLNFVSEIMYPAGMYVSEITYYWQNWILGYYNNHSVYYFMAICIALIYAEIKKKYVGSVCLLIVITISAIKVWSGGVVGSLFIVLVLIIYLYFMNKTIGNYYIYWLIHVAFFGIIIVSNSGVWRTVLTYCELLWGKGYSFYARYNLWKAELQLILSKPIIGYGIESQQARMREYGWALHSHNLTLELLHQGGVLCLALFIILVVVVGKNTKNINNKKLVGIVSICCLGWIVDTLTEPFFTPFVVAILVVANNLEKIDCVISECSG